jgi:hypothetical protein
MSGGVTPLSKMSSSLQDVKTNEILKIPAVATLMSIDFTKFFFVVITLLFYWLYLFILFSFVFYFFVECLNVVVLPLDYSVRAATDRVSALGR